MPDAFDFAAPAILMFVLMYSMGADLVEMYLKHPEVTKLLESDEKFDVCVFEIFAADALLVNKLMFLKIILFDHGDCKFRNKNYGNDDSCLSHSYLSTRTVYASEFKVEFKVLTRHKNRFSVLGHS